MIKTILTGLVLALATGAASATELFIALDGIPAERLSAAEMDAVVGHGIIVVERSTLTSSASLGSSLLLTGGTLIDADSGDTFLSSRLLGVHWENQANLEIALGGSPTLVVPQAGLGMIQAKPSVAK